MLFFVINVRRVVENFDQCHNFEIDVLKQNLPNAVDDYHEPKDNLISEIYARTKGFSTVLAIKT